MIASYRTMTAEEALKRELHFSKSSPDQCVRDSDNLYANNNHYWTDCIPTYRSGQDHEQPVHWIPEFDLTYPCHSASCKL